MYIIYMSPYVCLITHSLNGLNWKTSLPIVKTKHLWHKVVSSNIYSCINLYIFPHRRKKNLFNGLKPLLYIYALKKGKQKTFSDLAWSRITLSSASFNCWFRTSISLASFFKLSNLFWTEFWVARSIIIWFRNGGAVSSWKILNWYDST